jgi:glycosyltransferase involved in cell wall biosynthesis
MSARILLSAVLIVRNEERFLGECLRSIRDLADEVVIVDTGSTDRTREIARNAGARLHEFRWIDDFSAARNHALDLARGEWILYIDADERVRSCAAAELRAQLSDPSHVGYSVLLHARPGHTPYREMRIFRNHPTIRFRGIIHETIWPGITACRAARGGRIGRSDMVLEHHGYEGDQAHKHARNLPLLCRALREDPTRVFVLCHLATICLAIGREALAERAWGIALELVRSKRGRRLLPEDCLPYISLIQRRLAAGDDTGDLVAEARRRFPRNLQLVWLEGNQLAQSGQWADAVAVFERLVGCGEGGDIDETAGYDARLFGVWAFERLATCHFNLQNYAEGERFFGRAAACAPDTLEYRVKRALCARLAASMASRRAASSPA